MATKFGKKIKDLLKRLKMSQSDLARELGVSRGMINHWITGESNPKLASLKKISSATGTPLSFFLENENSNISLGDEAINIVRNDKELALLKKENELLKKEIELLKKENKLGK